MRLFFALLLFISALYSSEFNFYKKGSNDAKKPTLLVIGGIHGDEPGGYFAASILATHYNITDGNLWIVPDLNKNSMMANSRGINGDMNRKFANISKDDKDYKIVEDIKKIIAKPEVDLILNLHDGHGFYRDSDENWLYNTKAWGQTCVIDQIFMDSNHTYSDLHTLAQNASKHINSNLIDANHKFNVRNTNTKLYDKEMQQTLTYFALQNHKPAFAIESSKNLSNLEEKVFYQLNAIESFMNQMGIKFSRNFTLDSKNLIKIINNYGKVTINNNFILNLNKLKKSLSYIPLQSSLNEFAFTHPLGYIKKIHSGYEIFIGNKKVSTLYPSYHKNGTCDKNMLFLVDGEMKSFDFTSEIFVNDDIKVVKTDSSVRANIIGFTRTGLIDESDVTVSLKDFDKRFSIDTPNRSYRIEFYQKSHFCGMVLVHFK